jgi:hypothetical protein
MAFMVAPSQSRKDVCVTGRGCAQQCRACGSRLRSYSQPRPEKAWIQDEFQGPRRPPAASLARVGLNRSLLTSRRVVLAHLSRSTSNRARSCTHRHSSTIAIIFTLSSPHLHELVVRPVGFLTQYEATVPRDKVMRRCHKGHFVLFPLSSIFSMRQETGS